MNEFECPRCNKIVEDCNFCPFCGLEIEGVCKTKTYKTIEDMSVRQCASCGTQAEEAWNCCPKCGYYIQSKIITPLEDDWNYCPYCRKRFKARMLFQRITVSMAWVLPTSLYISVISKVFRMQISYLYTLGASIIAYFIFLKVLDLLSKKRHTPKTIDVIIANVTIAAAIAIVFGIGRLML